MTANDHSPVIPDELKRLIIQGEFCRSFVKFDAQQVAHRHEEMRQPMKAIY
jgi:hypothetical protein